MRIIKKVKRIWRGATGRNEKVIAKVGRMLSEENGVRKIWREHFEGLLNVKEDREVVTVTVGRKQGLHAL